MSTLTSLSVLLIRKYFKPCLRVLEAAVLFECLVNSEVFQTDEQRLGRDVRFECLVNSEVFQTNRLDNTGSALFECLVNSEVFQTQYMTAMMNYMV